MDPSNGLGHWMLLVAYERKGDLPKAIDEREKQAALWGQNPETAKEKIAPLRKAQAVSDAKRYWQSVLDSFGPQPEHAGFICIGNRAGAGARNGTGF